MLDNFLITSSVDKVPASEWMPKEKKIFPFNFLFSMKEWKKNREIGRNVTLSLDRLQITMWILKIFSRKTKNSSKSLVNGTDIKVLIRTVELTVKKELHCVRDHVYRQGAGFWTNAERKKN